MNAFKKTVLASAVLMSMGAGAAQASISNFDFNGAFVMYDGTSTSFTGANGLVDNGNGPAGDPVTGAMHMDFASGAGTAEMTGSPFFGSNWYARNITMQAGPSGISTHMLFDWGGSSAPGNTSGAGGLEIPPTSCGVANCDIDVTVVIAMVPGATPGAYDVFTIGSSMPGGPFAGFTPSFYGVATYTGETQVAGVPVPAAAWLLGSGLLGLVGVARRKVA